MNGKHTNLVSLWVNQADFPDPDTLIDSCGIGTSPIHLSISGTSYTCTSCDL